MPRMWRVGPNGYKVPARTVKGLHVAMSYAFTLLSQGTAEVVVTAPNGRDVYVVRKLAR